MLLVLLPALTLQAWFAYRAAQNTSAQFQEQLAGEVSARIFDKVLRFFEVPSRVVRYNAEQFRAGLLSIAEPHEMQQNFLLQLSKEPTLTFVSIGTANGEYYAASHPPLGEDRAPRMVQATAAEGYLMSHYRVDGNNRRGALISRDSESYDPRLRPWFKAAVGHARPRWYGAYRYVPYDALGIGMAAPLYDSEGLFVGVMTADVALLQLSQLLGEITADLGGSAFLFDEGGGLLATSTSEEIYSLQGSKTLRVQATESPNALVAVAARAILAAGLPKGRIAQRVNGVRYLLDWRQHTLPDGPVITMASMLPQSQFDELPRKLFVNLMLSSATIIVVSLILAVLVSRWLTLPLVALAAWATRLGRGEQADVVRTPHRIAEVESLSNALRFMAESVRYHTEHLEKEVAARTAELERANLALEELSSTDSLTGLANRRRFDEVLGKEVARARRNQSPLALIMLDVDHFKEYNDRYGHQAGDDCLIRLGTILQAHTQRSGDLAARYGGEEFIIVAAHCDDEDALSLAELLRQEVEAAAIVHEASPHGFVSVSLGVVVHVPDGNTGCAELLGLVDKALYRAKAAGRNCVRQERP